MADGTDTFLQLTPLEVARVCARDSALYARTFFPKSVRLPGPPAHREIDARLDDSSLRYVNLRCFRGSAKTSKLRIFTSKRIAYGISRTILYVGASEDHAARSIRWLRNAVERNTFWTSTFGLRPGAKWHETELEVIHGIDERPIWVLGVGITGNIRGINFDDYRPDLIILDDVITDENAATEEQREKIDNLILGALKASLTQEEPNAKFAMLQTPIHPEDASARASVDPQFDTFTFSCWTPETAELTVDLQESSWPEMFPTEQLRADKRAALARNKLSVFVREYECRLISPELASFRSAWLRLFDDSPERKGFFNLLVIDPVPPPSPKQMAKQLRGKDSEAHVVVGRKAGEYYILDSIDGKGHEPNWTVATAVELARRWRVNRILLLAVGYETVLEGMLKREMARLGVYWAVEVVPTKGKSKFDRITSALAGTASQGKLWCASGLTTFQTQFAEYGPTYTGHDDVLEAGAAGIEALANPYLELGAEDYFETDSRASAFKFKRLAP